MRCAIAILILMLVRCTFAHADPPATETIAIRHCSVLTALQLAKTLYPSLAYRAGENVLVVTGRREGLR